MATTYAGITGGITDPRAGVQAGENALGIAPSVPGQAGVRYGGREVRAKRLETGFYAITKQGGGLIAIWWALTHATSWVEWSAFAVFFVLNQLAITVCYHRYFMHRTFETSLPMRYVLGIWGQLGAFGSLRNWCADHRRHHARSDVPGDVHSPLFDSRGRPHGGVKGFRHSHIGWLFDDSTTDLTVYGKGLVGDPVIEFCHRTRVFWYLVSVLPVPALWGYAFGGTEAIIGTILIGGFLRMALSLQTIAMVNSVCHKWGTQRFKGHGKANNNVVVALLTCGEGWHNNHHGHPRSANFGLTWWEVDVASWVIRAMEKLGLVWNVRWTSLADAPCD